MSIATLYLAGLAYTAFSVIGVGFVILAALRRLGVLRTEQPASHILCAIALAIYWGAIFLAAVVAFNAKFAETATYVKFALDAVIVAAGVLYAHRELREIGRSLMQGGVLILAGGGLIVGTWAFLQFPHVLDSGQLRWTQDLLTRGSADAPSAMLGFSGLIVFLGRMFDAIPLATTAAALKPLLAVIAAVTAYHAADCLAPRQRGLVAVLFIALMAVSEFGLLGVIFLGKDSIYGILFSIAFLAALCRPEPSRHAWELGLYFSVAVTTGVIALPFMLAAYVLWQLLAAPEDKAWSTAPALYLVGLPVLPTALAGFFHAGLAAMFAAYLALGLAGFAFVKLAGKPAAALFGRVSGRLRSVRAWVPAALALPCVFLMPVDLPITAWRNQDGTLIAERRAPLDGKMDIFGYFLEHPVQSFTIGFGVIAALILGFTRLGRERAGLVAACTMPFAVLLAALVRAHSGLPVLENFHVWDIVKDIPLWYGGALFGLLAVVLLHVLASVVPVAWARSAALLVAGTALFVAGAGHVSRYEYTRPVNYTEIGGYTDRDMAVASAIAWRELRGRHAYFDMSLTVARYYFYSFQMYEVRPSQLDVKWLIKEAFPATTRIGIFARHDKMHAIRAFAASQKASIIHLAEIENGEGSLFAIDFDGRSRLDPARTYDGASVIDGAHDTEIVHGMRFRWLRASSEIAVTLVDSKAACVTLELFSTGRPRSSEIVAVEAPDAGTAKIDIKGSSMSAPRRAKIVVAVRDGGARLRLRAEFPEGPFPRDARPIAFGIRLPIAVNAAGTCPQ